jgi:hypothetical protein
MANGKDEFRRQKAKNTQPYAFIVLPSNNVSLGDSEDVFDTRRTVDRVQPSTLPESDHSMFNAVLANAVRTDSLATHFTDSVVVDE